MIPDAAPERLALPTLAPPPARTGFPWVATAAPVAVSLGIWGVTGSPYSLVFAALGPVVALGSVLDGRRQRRTTVRRDSARARAGLERSRRRVLELHERERARLERLAPPIVEACAPSRVASNWARAGAASGVDAAVLPVRLGRADRPPVVLVESGADAAESHELPPAIRSAAERVRAEAATLTDAPWVADARDGIGIVGPAAVARAVARSLALQLAASLSPASTMIGAPADETWVRALPHRATEESARVYRFAAADGNEDADADLLIAWASEGSELPPGLRIVVALDAPTAARLDAVSAAHALERATALAELAQSRGLDAGHARLPDAVRLADVLEAPAIAIPTARGGLRAPIGRDARGVVELDLVRDGPHAVVAGTTGAGKSELLVSWVLAMAARHPPSAVTFLLVDFKGGAAFAPLAGLPHVVGTVSDLDARRSARAIESLRAELLRRERMLAERGVRSIDELAGASASSESESAESEAAEPSLARLVVVVDEFAAVVSGQPELHELFADLSARGRSLGLHLILCTQRPSGVVRDAVLANITLRISLRVTDRGDSLAMLGTDAAVRLPAEPRGRALIADGGAAPREVQLALAEPGDAARLAAPGAPPSGMVWCEPLPEILPLAPLLAQALVEDGSGIPFGRLDLPSAQSQPIARHDPRLDGHLLVLGAARSGRSTALATLAAGAGAQGVGCLVIPADPAEAWTLLSELLEPGPRTARPQPRLLLLDDVDLLLERVDPDTRHELLELVTRVARSARSDSLVVSAQRLTGGLQALAGLFDARLLLRQPSRDEHVLSGGDGAAFDPRLPPGSGRMTGARGGGAVVQVALGVEPLPAANAAELPALGPEPGRPLAIVCPRPRELAGLLRERGVRTVVLGEQPPPEEGELRVSGGAVSIALLGDPDAWQAEWTLLGLVRREQRLAVIGCSTAELRAVARVRDAAPPLGDRPGECWLVEAGIVRRALLRLEIVER